MGVASSHKKRRQLLYKTKPGYVSIADLVIDAFDVRVVCSVVASVRADSCESGY